MKVSSRCYAVTGLGFVPPWSVNAGFVVGDSITLIIDTGANVLSGATLHGYASAIRPQNALLVLNCERHFDHIGGNSFFADRGIDIWGHHLIHRTPDEFAEQVNEFHEAIGDPVRRANHEENIFFSGTRLTNPIHPISQDLQMDLGGCPIEILLTPGHTETNVSVWVPAERILFSADTLVNGYQPNTAGACLSDWMHSLDRLEQLKALVVIPGHGPVAQDDAVEPLFARVRQAIHNAGQSVDQFVQHAAPGSNRPPAQPA